MATKVIQDDQTSTMELSPHFACDLLMSAHETIRGLLGIVRETHKDSDEALRAAFDILNRDWEIKADIVEEIIKPLPTFPKMIFGKTLDELRQNVEAQISKSPTMVVIKND